MPPHTHTVAVDGTGNNTSVNYSSFGALQNGKGNVQRARTAITNPAGGANGSTEAHNKMPPYYVLAFCQWIGY